MKYSILFLLTPLLFSCSDDTINLEVGDELITEDTSIDFSGVYHFGESEMETDLLILKAGNKYYAQIKSGDFNSDVTDFIWSFKNLKNVSVKGTKFFSNKSDGEFIMSDGKVKGLKIYKSWSAITEDDGSETGHWSHSVNNYYSGEFKNTSTKELTEEDLKNLSKTKLAIMRNEVFARYGYTFKVNGEMDNYFKQQKWYKGQHKNVDHFLTGLEKQNITLIKKMEKDAIDDVSEFTLDDFPKKWFLLSEKSKGSEELIINDWCEAEIEQINIEKDASGNWMFFVLYGQDSDVFNLISFEATEKEMELYQVVSGHFVLERPNYEGKDTVTYDFMWNKDLMFCHFEKFFSENAMMVSEKNRDNYETIEEKCDYLNEGY